MSEYGYAEYDQRKRVAQHLAQLCIKGQCPIPGVACPFYKRYEGCIVHIQDWYDYLFGELIELKKKMPREFSWLP